MNKNSEISKDIGGKIRRRRRKLQITLNTMSEQTDLSIGFLSQVERGVSTPTLTSLYIISRALGVSVDYLISLPQMDTDIRVTHSHKRVYHPYGDGQYMCPIHTNHDAQELDSMFVKIAPRGQSEENIHDIDEVVYCLEGTLIYHIEGVDYTLNTGDVIYVPGHTCHRWSNPSDTDETTVLWVGSLGEFK